MTLFQQFTDSATGSSLNKHFRSVRIKLMLFIAGLLGTVLFISAYSTFEANRIGLNTARQQTGVILPRPGFIDQFQDYEVRAHKRALDQIKTNVIIGHTLLFALLSTGTWIGLYFLLLPLSRSHQEQEQFLAEASHDLRTPLAILYSELSLAQQETDIQLMHKTIHSALGEIKRLRYLSDSLLAQVAGEKTEWETISIALISEDIWTKLQPANSKRITLTIRGLRNKKIHTHQAHLYRIFYNLLDNIIKYAEEESEAHIDISETSIIFSNASSSRPRDEQTGSILIRRLCALIHLHYSTNWENGTYRTRLDFTKK